jgi:hypothetical protein
MRDDQIKRYERRIAEEERCAREASTPDIAVAHHQTAMLYKTELSLVRNRRARTVGETLAGIW